MVVKAAWLAAALASVGAVAQLEDMDVAFEDGLDHLNSGAEGGLNETPGVSFTLAQWDWGTIPKRCYDGAMQDNLCEPTDMEVYDVTFPDVSPL